jgi:hypothetical protein
LRSPGPRASLVPVIRLTVLAPLLAALGACTAIEGSARRTVDPVVVVHGESGDELAVSTDYGVVFLGRTAQSGRIEFTVWFGDGPSREEGIVEPMGGGVYATEGEILLPSVALCFELPPAGTGVIVRGRRAGEPFEVAATLATDPRVRGVLLEAGPELDALTDDALGAGVFLVTPRQALQLVGLLSGRLELDGRTYLTAVGPEDLWRAVVHRRNSDRPRRWVYREDVL